METVSRDEVINGGTRFDERIRPRARKRYRGRMRSSSRVTTRL
jgi:hypothetical protein